MARITHACDCTHGKVIKELLQPSCKVASRHFFPLRKTIFMCQRNRTKHCIQTLNIQLFYVYLTLFPLDFQIAIIVNALKNSSIIVPQFICFSLLLHAVFI